MRQVNKKSLFPYVEFSTDVKKSLWQLEEFMYFFEQEGCTRVEQAAQTFGLDVVDDSPRRVFNVPEHFLKLERRFAKSARNLGDKYLSSLSLLSSCDEELFESEQVTVTQGVDPILHIAFPSDMPKCYYFILQKDAKWEKQFFRRLFPQNNSTLFLFSERCGVIRPLSIGKFGDIFKVDPNYCALVSED